MTGTEQPCSAIARTLNEPLYGTVPRASGWILLEHPAPWGPKALEQSGLDPDLAFEIDQRSSRLGMRVLLIRRRPGRYRPEGLRCFLVWSHRSGTWMESLTLETPGDLLDLDLSKVSGLEPAGLGTPVTDPIYLVCTHGRRDPCCAERGRRLINSLPYLEDRIWESSHQGGHRFAANLACFPEAIFYGRVGPAAGEEILARHPEGTIVLDHLRGRSTDEPVVQAADFFARRQTGLMGFDDLIPQGYQKLSDGPRVEVAFRQDSSRYLVHVEVADGVARPTSCRSDKLETLRIYRLLGVSEA